HGLTTPRGKKMRTIAKTFEQLKTKKEGGLIAYVTAGDPHITTTKQIVHSLSKGGADIIELGIPFSDPIADGPTIQAASQRALNAKTTPKQILTLTESLRSDIPQPIVFMTYYNPIYKMGLNTFFESVQASGVNGVIVPDLPPEEANEYKKTAETHDIDTIFLATPSTSQNRLKKILSISSGFLYLVSLFGVTGTRETIKQSTRQLIQQTTQLVQGTIPLAVGFGISKPNHVQTVIQEGANAAIVGSSFVKIIEKNQQNESTMLTKLTDYCTQLKNATTLTL
ncbi:MAG: tryptophan synthase subunit alpha, partial [Candidatus Ranarchaeia archaeon]